MRYFTASLTTMVHVIASINATVSVRDMKRADIKKKRDIKKERWTEADRSEG